MTTQRAKTAERSRVTERAATAALTAFIQSPEAGMSDAMRAAIEAALPFLQPVAHTLPQDSSASRTVASIELGTSEYRWNVVSDCGVVKVYSSRDGCLLAMNSTRARMLARELAEALEDAASSVDRASRGGER